MRLKVLAAKEAAIQEITAEARARLKDASKDGAKYRKLMTDLLVQARRRGCRGLQGCGVGGGAAAAAASPAGTERTAHAPRLFSVCAACSLLPPPSLPPLNTHAHNTRRR